MVSARTRERVGKGPCPPYPHPLLPLHLYPCPRTPLPLTAPPVCLFLRRVRLALVKHASSKTRFAETGESRLCELAGSLQLDLAVTAACAGVGAYMASLLAQPVGAVRNDLTQQLTDWTHAKSLGERPKKHSAQKTNRPRPGSSLPTTKARLSHHQSHDQDHLSHHQSNPKFHHQLNHLAPPLPPSSAALPMQPPIDRLAALLSGDAAAAVPADGGWLAKYALEVGFLSASSTPSGGTLPAPIDCLDSLAVAGDRNLHSEISDPAFHLLRLMLAPILPLRPLAPVPPPSGMASRATWVKLRDYSLAWHLRLVVGELLGFKPPSAAEPLHTALFSQANLKPHFYPYGTPHFPYIYTSPTLFFCSSR